MVTRGHGVDVWKQNMQGTPASGGFPMAQWVKNLLAMQETQELWVQSLGWEDPLKEEIGTHSSLLAWRIPWTEKPGRLHFTGSKRVRHD